MDQQAQKAVADARIALTFYRLWMEKAKPGSTTEYPFGIAAELNLRRLLCEPLPMAGDLFDGVRS